MRVRLLFILFILWHDNGVFSLILFQRPTFDCRRIPATYCCSSRVRRSCPELCSGTPCGRQPLYPTMPPSLTSLLGPHFRLPPLPIMPFGSIGLPPPVGTPFGGFPPSPGSVPYGGDISPVDVDTETEVTSITVQTPFPTLIPQPQQITHEPPIFNTQPIIPWGTSATPGPWLVATTIAENIEGPGETVNIETKHQPEGAVDGVVKSGTKKRNKKKKNHALKPPVFPDGQPELIEFGGEDEKEVTPDPPKIHQPGIIPPPGFQPEPPTPSAQVSPPPIVQPPGIFPTEPTIIDQEELLRTEEPISSHNGDIGSFAWRRRDLPEIEETFEKNTGGLKFVIKPHEGTEAGASERTTHPIREVAGGKGVGTWKFSIAPSGYLPTNGQTTTENRKNRVLPSQIHKSIEKSTKRPDNKKNRIVNVKNREDLEKVINIEKFNRLINALFSNETISRFTISPARNFSMPTGKISRQPFITTFTKLPIQQQLISSTTTFYPIAKKCGQAPDFTPCLPYEIANVRLLNCCQRKNMPLGCLELCRYDITQKEIKKAFDAGKCGLLNVAPFLECASSGNNNLECCKHKGVSQKSGPQCEVFCNPGGGFGVLGLQHLACQNVIGDLLQCHYSGLRE